MKNDLKKLISGYLIFFCIFMLIICSLHVPEPIGEWDDYSLPIASIFNDHNFGITQEDVIVYKQIFPHWSEYIDSYQLSGYMTKSGSGEMAWYFPTYGMVCIPMVLTLQLLKLPAVFAFPYTNLAVLMISLIFVFKYLKATEGKKLLLILLLSVNPIVFYISWTSAEVFIYSMLVIGLTSWYNKWYKSAAVFISVAGMVNPTIMSIGIIMIIEYMIKLLKQKNKTEKWNKYIRRIFPQVVGYGCCYIIGVVPMVYNYYNIGYINLTASAGFMQGTESILARCIAYLFDLNFGLLPYYPILMVIGLIFLMCAVAKRNISYIEWIATFFLNLVLYSVMVHINCGMSGIARYNVWGVLPLIFAVVGYGDEIVERKSFINAVEVALGCGIALVGAIVMNYNPYLAANVHYMSMTPVAEWALDYFPALYNPLYSTFNSRTTHQNGGYRYADELPIVYSAEDGYVRKILALAANKEEILTTCISRNESNDWLANRIDELGTEIGYISVPEKYKIVRAFEWEPGALLLQLLFTTEGNNITDYVVTGINASEEWGSWTEGNTFMMRFVSTSTCDSISGTINCSVYNNTQDVSIYVNDIEVLSWDDSTGGLLKFNFENPGDQQLVEIRIELPDAISPAEFGYDDGRILGLGIHDITFEEVVVSPVDVEIQ